MANAEVQCISMETQRAYTKEKMFLTINNVDKETSKITFEISQQTKNNPLKYRFFINYFTHEFIKTDEQIFILDIKSIT